MAVLSRSVIFLTLVFCGSLPDVIYAQHTLNPRSITQLSEMFDDAKMEGTYSLSQDYDRRPSLSDKGLLFVTDNSRTIQTIGEDGTVIWEKRSPERMATVVVKASPDGRYVLFVHILHEDYAIYEFLTSSGQSLWKARKHRPSQLSGSGGNLLLISDSRRLGRWEGQIAVLEAHSGEELWRSHESFNVVREWGPDQLACIENGMISVVAPTDGRTLWSNSIDEGFLSYRPGRWVRDLVSSEEGKRLVLTMSKQVIKRIDGIDRKRTNMRMGGFNQTGTLLWSRDIEGIITPLGFTPDSRFLVAQMHTPENQSLELVDADTGATIWTLQARVFDNEYVLMNNRLILTKRGGILVLNLDSSGQLLDQALLSDREIMDIGFRTGSRTQQIKPDQRVVLLLRDIRSKRALYVVTLRR